MLRLHTIFWVLKYHYFRKLPMVPAVYNFWNPKRFSLHFAADWPILTFNFNPSTKQIHKRSLRNTLALRYPHPNKNTPIRTQMIRTWIQPWLSSLNWRRFSPAGTTCTGVQHWHLLRAFVLEGAHPRNMVASHIHMYHLHGKLWHFRLGLLGGCWIFEG